MKDLSEQFTAFCHLSFGSRKCNRSCGFNHFEGKRHGTHCRITLLQSKDSIAKIQLYRQGTLDFLASSAPESPPFLNHQVVTTSTYMDSVMFIFYYDAFPDLNLNGNRRYTGPCRIKIGPLSQAAWFFQFQPQGW